MSPQRGKSTYSCCVFKVCPVSELPPRWGREKGPHPCQA